MYGFLRVAATTPELRVANCKFNSSEIIRLIEEAEKANVRMLVFPELSLTGYTCGDLFLQETLLKSSNFYINEIAEFTKGKKILAIIGAPYRYLGKLYNCAFVIEDGKIIGIVPKTFIPNYSEFYEGRWFDSGSSLGHVYVNIDGNEVPFGTDLIFQNLENPEQVFAIEICEDLWTPIPPSSKQALLGANIVFNLSASNELVGKSEYRRELVKNHSARCALAYVYASSGVGESSTDLVFGGHSIIAEYGSILGETERFKLESQLLIRDIDIQRLVNERQKNMSYKIQIDEKVRVIKYGQSNILNDKNATKESIFDENLYRYVDPHPFVPSDLRMRDLRCEEIFAIQTSGLAKRLKHISAKSVVIGISGGLDSTLALLVTVKAFDLLGLDRQSIVAVTMPGFGTTGRTYNNAVELIKNLGAGLLEIDIKDACLLHFKDINHDKNVHDVTYENVQARERTQLLMDIANKNGGIVIGTGDMSELALGWCTYNGDHMSMYGVNCGVPKTLVKYLVSWAAEHKFKQEAEYILKDILDTPISPELVPPAANGEITQKTEDIVGPYELHDFYMYHMLRYGAEPQKILFLAKKAFNGVYGEEEILKWLRVFVRRFFMQQFKRSCLPDGPKVGSISLSPRGDWRMPSDAEAEIWLSELA